MAIHSQLVSVRGASDWTVNPSCRTYNTLWYSQFSKLSFRRYARTETSAGMLQVQESPDKVGRRGPWRAAPASRGERLRRRRAES